MGFSPVSKASFENVHRERPPVAFVVLGGIAVAFFLLPLVGLLWRAPWTALPRLLSEREIRAAIELSLISSLWATLLSILFGLPLAWLLARAEFFGRSFVRGLTTLPLVLPPVVGGVALLLALGRVGLLGRWLDSAFGASLFGTVPGVVIAETFVAMPFLVLSVEAALRAMDRRYESAAATLGASRWLIFSRITVPMIAPALGAGAVLSWARALGEFGATITFAGNLPGTTQTIPLAVYSQLQREPGGAIALSLVLVAISLVVLVWLRDRWWPAE
jgi:molybdate transport system permease protein